MKRTYHTAIIYKPYFKEISDMGKKKWIAPFAALILVCMIGTLLIYPIINMQPKNIVIGLLSLDKGAELPQGKVDLGDKLTKNITSATEKSDDPSAVRWKIYKNEETLRRDIKEQKVHGGLIVPKDFTACQISSIDSFNKLNDSIAKLAEGMSRVNEGTLTFAEGLSALPPALDSLSGGLVSVKHGVSALQDGAEQAGSGIDAFSERSSMLVSGASTLSEATGRLDTGMSTLSGSVSSMVTGITDQLMGRSGAEKTSDGTPSILFVINQGGNVTVASVIESMVTKMFAQAGLTFDTEYINPVSAGFTAAYFGTCVFIFVYIVSYVTGVMLTRNHPLKGAPDGGKLKPAFVQLVYAAMLSLCAGGLITGIISVISDMELLAGDTFLFLAIAAFALIILVAGSLDLFGMAGMAIPIMMLVLGIGTANMPYEFLPEIWQDWIYPWMPLQIISNGIKQMVYTGVGWWNDLTADLVVVIAVGLILLFTAALKPEREKALAER